MKKLKTVRHLSFAKSLSLLLFLIVFCVRDGSCKICKGVNGFFSMFCQILGAFWWVPIMVLMEKEHSDTVLKEHSDSARNKVCVCVCVCVCANSIVKAS